MFEFIQWIKTYFQTSLKYKFGSIAHFGLWLLCPLVITALYSAERLLETRLHHCKSLRMIPNWFYLDVITCGVICIYSRPGWVIPSLCVDSNLMATAQASQTSVLSHIAMRAELSAKDCNWNPSRPHAWVRPCVLLFDQLYEQGRAGCERPQCCRSLGAQWRLWLLPYLHRDMVRLKGGPGLSTSLSFTLTGLARIHSTPAGATLPR